MRILLFFLLLLAPLWAQNVPLRSGQDLTPLVNDYEAALRKEIQAKKDFREDKISKAEKDRAVAELAAAEDRLAPAYADQLVQDAAKYLQDMDAAPDPQGQGFKYWGDNILSLRTSGHIVIGQDLKGSSTNAEVPFGPTWESYTRTLKLNPSLVLEAAREEIRRRALARGETLPVMLSGTQFENYSGKSLDPERLREAIVAFFAFTLYHEKIHVHQSFFPHCREEAREGPAHTCGIRAAYLKIQQLHQQYLDETNPEKARALLERMLILLRVMKSKNGELSEVMSDWPKTSPFRTSHKNADDWIKLYEKLLSEALEKRLSKEEFQRLKESLKSQMVSQIELQPKDESKRVASLPGRAVTEHNLLVTWTGKNRAAGHIFDLRLDNRGPEIVSVSLAPGMVFLPPDPRFQRMMLGAPLQAEVPPGQVCEVPVQGYCLDPELLPPAPQPLPYLTLCPELVPGFEGFKSILESGNQLAEQNAYRNLFEPQRYKETVIQRALWYEASKDSPKPFNREKLQQDLTKQLQEAGKTPQPEQVQKASEDLWSDVDLTLKKASSQPR